MSSVNLDSIHLTVPHPETLSTKTPYPYEQLIRLDLSEKEWVFESVDARLQTYTALFKTALQSAKTKSGALRMTAAYHLCLLAQKHPVYKTCEELAIKVQQFMKQYKEY